MFQSILSRFRCETLFTLVFYIVMWLGKVSMFQDNSIDLTIFALFLHTLLSINTMSIPCVVSFIEWASIRRVFSRLGSNPYFTVTNLAFVGSVIGSCLWSLPQIKNTANFLSNLFYHIQWVPCLNNYFI